MSIIFGVKLAEGNVVEEPNLLKMAQATERFAPDGATVRCKGRVGMGFQPYHTHQRSRLESQPFVDTFGNVVALDGRIDNHQELCKLLEINDPDSPDSQIVLAAFRRWGTNCFAKLVGDWSVALWGVANRQLVLARDHAGSRPLYVSESDSQTRWSTYLETLVSADQRFALDRNYLSCFISGCSRLHLTPYNGIRVVPPGHFLILGEHGYSTHKHWVWQTRHLVRYQSDSEYEAHFLELFETSILRRTGLGAPTVAQLSGGIDSTSIVFTADHLQMRGVRPGPALETISYYDDTEPDWNERPNFTFVERLRRRRGIHVEVSFAKRSLASPDAADGMWLIPGYDRGRAASYKTIDECLRIRDYRTVLAGIGGDDLLGGVPAFLPELGDSLVSLRLPDFFDRSMQWSLRNRNPITHTISSTVSFLVDLYGGRARGSLQTLPWTTKQFSDSLADGINKDPIQTARLGRRPSAIASDLAWWRMLETLPHLEPTPYERREYRYPYLDKELVEFLLCIPRDQLLRPGQRRSLMRRALEDIVPNEILGQTRKAVVSRGPLRLLESSQILVSELFRSSVLASLGWIDVHRLLSELRLLVDRRDPTYTLPILNTIYAELWLQASVRNGQISV